MKILTADDYPVQDDGLLNRGVRMTYPFTVREDKDPVEVFFERSNDSPKEKRAVHDD